MAEEPEYTNRLIHEKSPYLLQHAHNPVDWYPWGEEAFVAAQIQDKPIFLSIGYSTCHWCHVMERESFDNPEVAEELNRVFINIKIDREELPEVDTLYMEFAQSMMAGAAGWPLNVILTPHLKPFYATTYLPPEGQPGIMNLYDLIHKIDELWHSEEKDQVIGQAEQVVQLFEETSVIEGDTLPAASVVEDTMEILYQASDPTYGGLRGVPKFPIGYHINFYLSYAARTRDSRALFLAEKALTMMQRGGIYDHIGGGFSRYAVDELWVTPHFEKMLYDNAILIQGYARAWQSTHNPLHKEVCRATIDYILREMTHTEGGFFSAQDSETQGVEGYYYTWTYNELKEVLPESDFLTFCKYYNASLQGNFDGRNILHTPVPLDDFCRHHKENPDDVSKQLKRCKEILLNIRGQRTPPLKDDKILTASNSLMINALAVASTVFKEPKYLEAAVRAMRFTQKHLVQDKTLFRRWREGETRFTGGLEEYACVIRSLLTLCEAGCNSSYLQWAVTLCQEISQRFKASEKGAFFQSDASIDYLIARRCPFSDGAEPSGNAIHCENLLRLHRMTGEPSFLHQAEDILRSVNDYLKTYSPGYIYHVMNTQRYYDAKAPNLVIALNEKEELKSELTQLIHERYIPHRTVVWTTPKDQQWTQGYPFLAPHVPIEGKTTLYICDLGKCQEPLTELEKMKEALSKF